MKDERDWMVTVYRSTTDDEVVIVTSWLICNRTEQQADKEAMHEVEQHHVGCDWTMVEYG